MSPILKKVFDYNALDLKAIESYFGILAHKGAKIQ